MGATGTMVVARLWDEADPPTRRLAGTALNPAAPVDHLLRLLADGPPAVRMVLCRDRELPGPVVDAIVAHSDPRARGFLARNPHTDPAHRAHLVDDPEWHVRAALGDGPYGAMPAPPWAQPRPLPDAAVVRMLTEFENELLDGLYRVADRSFLRTMHTHPVPEVRIKGALRWSSLTPEERETLLADPDDRVREAAERAAQPAGPVPDRPCHARTHLLMYGLLDPATVSAVLASGRDEERAMIAQNPGLPADVLALLTRDRDPHVREVAADRPDLGPAEVAALVTDPDPGVRRTISRHPALTAAQRAVLATDPDPDVRLAISRHPALTEAERAAVDYRVTQEHAYTRNPYERTGRTGAEHRRLATSGHPLLRRDAAGHPGLPADLVPLLAGDPDLGVRVLLALHHPDAPPELLVGAYLDHPGPAREELTARPDFPTRGLARFADHPEAEVRLLALRDPELAPGPADRLTRDPEARVRSAAARHPRLPAARLAALLDDRALDADGGELAFAAAANPSLPVAELDRLAVAAGLPPRRPPR
ncbi:hypothetical protein ACWEQL_22145 [Kitasatospora sp. NPDC004240]